jgi:hypothetical protein
MSEPGPTNPEVPEADALDQERDVDPEPRTFRPSRDVEVPEADALDQAREVPLPEPD